MAAVWDHFMAPHPSLAEKHSNEKKRPKQNYFCMKVNSISWYVYPKMTRLHVVFKNCIH